MLAELNHTWISLRQVAYHLRNTCAHRTASTSDILGRQVPYAEWWWSTERMEECGKATNVVSMFTMVKHISSTVCFITIAISLHSVDFQTHSP